ncbi:uncharacterized protein LOC122883756 isoform X2 [Siniperca chuatsi]|uniref:uncharacterized protein LOC122883756 isoform X1 n=1 Tax=Siniperca chuatsi TaxID=119488 RepID=UPI001CE1F21D|nr:uncharacterized protein LOC122883756 isoform X1 [Siniperca chuatsi]XP_044068813.1 uncharacterized protein LOC122883756 isoform X2 [Siniperca chuatsi]
MSGNFLGKCLCSMLGIGAFIAGCIFLLVTAFPIVQIALGAVYMHECPAAPVIPVYVMVCGIMALLIMGLFALPKFFYPAALGSRIWALWILSLVLFFLIWFVYGSYQIYSVYPPNYAKNTTDPNSFNDSVLTPAAPDNNLGLTLENQNQSLPNLNQTWMINTNRTLRKLIQTLALSNISSEINREHLNATQLVSTAVPYCDRTVYLFAFWTTTLVYVFAANVLVTIICLYGFMKITNKFIQLLGI